MNECVALTKDMLKNPIRIQVDDKSLDFARAKQLANAEAKKVTAAAARPKAAPTAAGASR